MRRYRVRPGSGIQGERELVGDPTYQDLPKVLTDFDPSLQPSIKREQIESLQDLGFHCYGASSHSAHSGLARDPFPRHDTTVQLLPLTLLGKLL